MVHCTSLGSYCTLRWSDRQLVGTESESPRNSSPRLARSCWSCMMSPPSSSTTSSCLPVEKITSLKRVGLNLLCSLFRFKDWSNHYTIMFSFQYHIISTSTYTRIFTFFPHMMFGRILSSHCHVEDKCILFFISVLERISKIMYGWFLFFVWKVRNITFCKDIFLYEFNLQYWPGVTLICCM